MVDTDTDTGKAAFAGSLTAVVVGVAVLIGWICHIEVLKTVYQGTVTMNPVSAVGIILAGASLSLALRAPRQKSQVSRNRFIFLARLSAYGVVLIGFLRLAAIFTGWDFGVDQWLFPLQVADQLPIPSRIAPNAALNFLLLGGALLFVDVKHQSVRFCVEASVGFVIVGSLLAILGYTYNVQSFYRVGDFIPMAVYTGIAFLVLGCAVLLTHTDSGLLAIFAGDNPGGAMARRLLPAMILIPSGFGWLELHGELEGVFSSELGNAMFVIAYILCFTLLVSWSAKALFDTDLDRKKIEKVLRDSEEKFHQLADNISDVFWITSPDLNVMHYVSPGYAVIWGRSTESLYARPHEWIEAILPEEREHVFAVFAGLMKDKPEVNVEYRIARPDGTIRWVHDHGVQVRDAAGALVRLTGVATDITEHKRKDETVNHLAAIVENSDEAIISKTLQGIVTSWNPAAEKMYGYTESEMIGQSLQKLIPPDRLTEESEILADFEKGILARRMETVRVRKNGQSFDVSATISAIKDSNGKVVGISKIARDITKRKQAEESLRLFESAVHQCKESIVITDTQLDLPGPKILFVNPAFSQMTGYRAEEALGKTPRILQGPKTDKAVLSRLRRNLERGEIFEGETINYRKDGREFNLEWQIAPLHNAGGTITHLVAIQHDITDRKRLETHLLQSQKMETVGKLAGGIAHEFNSILTAIIGQSELLLTDLPAESPLTRNAVEIGKAANRAATLTRQLLAYGRKQILQPEILDLNAIMTGLESSLRHLMGVNADVRIIPAAGLKAIKADAGQIEQVIMNLAINAHDAMPNGGKLTLETANVHIGSDSLVPHSELKPGNYTMLAITDTGTGMSADAKSHAFDPFFSTKAVGEGTGLGLSTCYGIIKQSGGHINIYSEPARGTTFKIYLPQVGREVKSHLPQLDPLQLPRGTETILLVEDDPSLRAMAATLLGRLGYTVLSAANGIEALNLKQQRDIEHIDLLFTDVVMPQMGGKELSERMLVLYPRTKILFTSAYTENAIVHQGMLKKGVALLQKPFTPSALARKMREVLDQAGASRP